MRSKKFLSGIFLLSWLAVFCIAGGLEQEYISCGQAFAVSALNYAIMAYSGFRSGMLTLPDKGKEPAPLADGTGSKGKKFMKKFGIFILYPVKRSLSR